MEMADCRPAVSTPLSLESMTAAAEGVALAFLDREGDGVAGALGVLDGSRLDHARVREAVLLIVPAHQLLVVVDALGIVEGRALEDVEPARLAGGDDAAQVALRVGAIADERDAVDLADLALLDDEDHLHAAVALVDALGLHRGRKAPLPAVEIAHAHRVGVRPRLRVAQPRLEVHLLLELGLVDGGIALEGDARHERVLDHMHDHGRAAPLDAHIRKDGRRKQGLDGLVGLRRVVGTADCELQAGADGLGLDTAVAGDLDCRNRLGRPYRGRTQPAKQQGDSDKKAGRRIKTHPHTGVTTPVGSRRACLPREPAPARHPLPQPFELFGDCGGNGHRGGMFLRKHKQGRAGRLRGPPGVRPVKRHHEGANPRSSGACARRACRRPPTRSRSG